MGDIRTKQIDDVLVYMQRHPDRLLTLKEIGNGIDTHNMDSLSGAVSRICERFPNAERVQRGVFRWNSQVREARTSIPDEMIVRVVARRPDGRTLVVDVDTETLYLIQQFDF